MRNMKHGKWPVWGCSSSALVHQFFLGKNKVRFGNVLPQFNSETTLWSEYFWLYSFSTMQFCNIHIYSRGYEPRTELCILTKQRLIIVIFISWIRILPCEVSAFHRMFIIVSVESLTAIYYARAQRTLQGHLVVGLCLPASRTWGQRVRQFMAHPLDYVWSRYDHTKVGGRRKESHVCNI